MELFNKNIEENGMKPEDAELRNMLDQINKICVENSSILNVKAAWRVDTKERIEKHFNQQIPWEMCSFGLEVGWENVLYNMSDEYDIYWEEKKLSTERQKGNKSHD